MPLIPNTYNEVRYTHYRDVVVLMSDVQKVQAALIPDGVNPADYEILVSEQSSNGDIVYYNYYPTWTTLPALPDFADFVPLASCQIDTATGSTGPVPPSVTAWYQFRLTVRKKSNHADMATGVIRLVPTVNMVTAQSSNPIAGWNGGYTATHDNPGGEGSVARSELELFVRSNGQWQVFHYRGDAKTPYLQAEGIWLPQGKTAADYTFAVSMKTGMMNSSLTFDGPFVAIPTNGAHTFRSWARIVSAGFENDLTITGTARLSIKEVATGTVTASQIDFENTVRA